MYVEAHTKNGCLQRKLGGVDANICDPFVRGKSIKQGRRKRPKNGVEKKKGLRKKSSSRKSEGISNIL